MDACITKDMTVVCFTQDLLPDMLFACNRGGAVPEYGDEGAESKCCGF